MAKLCYDTDPVSPAAAREAAPGVLADADTHAALRRLAEICIEAHAIVAREGPDEVRRPLEALLGRVGRHLGGEGVGGARDDTEVGTDH